MPFAESDACPRFAIELSRNMTFAIGLLLLNLGSPYVPLDNWVYPAFERLNALGYAPDAEGLTRPWTRAQCLVLTEEAADIASRRSTKLSAGVALNDEALHLISALKDEFASHPKNVSGVRIESLYTRFLEIAGPPLNDSYHFGQTIANDYGRPYGRGANGVAGFSASATWNRFSAYFRCDIKAPRAPRRTPSGCEASSRKSTRTRYSLPSRKPVQTASIHSKCTSARSWATSTSPSESRSLWWGPGSDSAFHFSDNAEPAYMLRVAQTNPIVLPGPFRFLGRIRGQFVVGRLSGHQFPPRPFWNAQKITLQLTPDFELGFTRSAIFGGVGHPLTAHAIAASFFSTTSSASYDAGDRRSGFDFKWHVPGLRRYLTIYSDSLADDDPNPLDNPRRAAWGPGLYLATAPPAQTRLPPRNLLDVVVCPGRRWSIHILEQPVPRCLHQQWRLTRAR